MSKLALGSAQFGLSYGIANQKGQVNFSEAEKIVKYAKKSNINLIDTAISYGNSEEIIGEIGVKNFNLVTKLPTIPNDCLDINSWVVENVRASLSRLKAKSLYGLLIHSTGDLLGPKGKKLIEALNIVKLKGLAKKIGISVYDPIECERVMSLTRIDIVQAPLNIIDQRLVISGWLSRLNSEEIEVHARSAFLQGLLLMSPENIPKSFQKWSKIFDQWSRSLKINNLSATEVCLLYLLSIKEINRVIVGVDSVLQLNELVKKSKLSQTKLDWSFMISNDPMLINPMNWGKL